MADERYDVSPEQKEILLERAKRRAFLRNEFQKQIWDPHRHASLEGGAVVSCKIDSGKACFGVMLCKLMDFFLHRTDILRKKFQIFFKKTCTADTSVRFICSCPKILP